MNPASEIDTSHYVGNDGGVFSVNHITLATAEDSSVSHDHGTLELYRSSLQSALSSYVASKFISEQSAGTVAVKDGRLHAYICTEKPNLRNYWSGKWTSSWVITVNNGGQSTISGDIKIHAHYFEDGNVQMISNKSVPAATINGATEAELAASVIKHIKVYYCYGYVLHVSSLFYIFYCNNI